MSSPIASSLVPLQAGDIGMALIFMLIPLLLTVVVIAGFWKAFAKAGEPGWAAIIPIYNAYVMVKISGNPAWWLILFFIPVINFIAAIKISIDVAKAFGQGTGFGLGLAFLGFIFWPLLGFGDYDYVGAPGDGSGSVADATAA
ncbi:MAG: DUF5684 domain-containing protein [Natrialbaceae archaeon]|nr:DUF5684 domain-containing protein [Natrialbaceae archaeon]